MLGSNGWIGVGILRSEKLREGTAALWMEQLHHLASGADRWACVYVCVYVYDDRGLVREIFVGFASGLVYQEILVLGFRGDAPVNMLPGCRDLRKAGYPTTYRHP